MRCCSRIRANARIYGKALFQLTFLLRASTPAVNDYPIFFAMPLEKTRGPFPKAHEGCLVHLFVVLCDGMELLPGLSVISNDPRRAPTQAHLCKHQCWEVWSGLTITCCTNGSTVISRRRAIVRAPFDYYLKHLAW